MAYTRPFSQSRGEIPALTMKMIDLKLSEEKRALHDRLMLMRNQIMAHSDAEMMRMTTQAFDVPLRSGEPPLFLIQAVFDEGVTLLGALLLQTNELLREVFNATYHALHEDVQANPELFNLRVDSDRARAARNMDV